MDPLFLNIFEDFKKLIQKIENNYSEKNEIIQKQKIELETYEKHITDLNNVKEKQDAEIFELRKIILKLQQKQKQKYSFFKNIYNFFRH